MTLFQHIRQLLTRKSAYPSQGEVSSVPVSIPVVPEYNPHRSLTSTDASPLPAYTQEPLPGWLADADALRDEGVLFGLSNARPDEKIAQIRAYFTRQIAPLDESIDEQSEKIGELNLFIEQRENRILSLRDQLTDLRESQPKPTNLIRTSVSLLLSVGICISNFYLIDETLRPVFPNRWIAVGIFLAGMFNLFGRTSFFYEEGAKISGRRILTEIGLPFAASVFVLIQAYQTQPVGQAIALFVFILFLFLLAGSLFLTNLTSLQTDLTISKANRLLALNKTRNIPRWETEIDRLTREVDTIRTQKWPIVTTLGHIQAQRSRLNTQRDEFVNLFLSEFELARSLRDRLTEQQRKSMMNYE
ncbi:hypothetical protein [Spirosoma fluviale]|uniref:Multidrug transporter EmrE n=1 Tax=Spirosoma fluviale TaxID=1597977 RepID=A0A286FBS2_9BACT|nr:hypothetical protein [Spirosoma fluviale]SOD80681.1 Multidrug transporter EmrE [Spirosoma fluviale]